MIGQLDEQVVLVIDDLHELRSASAVAQLGMLLNRMPPTLRAVLATRRDLQLATGRLRLAGELTEIRAADLRFTLAEARELLAGAGSSWPRLSWPSCSTVTVLTGPLADRAALHGVLAQIEALGLELLAMRRLEP
jgi:hypothetical protein